MPRRIGATTPEDLLLRTWDLVHHARSFPAVQAPLTTALQEIAKILRLEAKPEEAPESIVETGPTSALSLA
jgi:hypothetical protein